MAYYSDNDISPAHLALNLASIVLGAVGASVFLCMSVIGRVFADSFGFNAMQTCQFSWMQLACASQGCLLSLFYTKRVATRVVFRASLGMLLAMHPMSKDRIFQFFTAKAVVGVVGGVAAPPAGSTPARMSYAEKNIDWDLEKAKAVRSRNEENRASRSMPIPTNRGLVSS